MSQAQLFGKSEARPWFESTPAIPQFSILNARGGEWQSRKALWLQEIGDGTGGRSAAAFDCHDGKNGNLIEGHNTIGTSGFDPVLAELVYRWYSRPGAMVVDPFCGGITRGAVADALGRRYWGCDLSRAQVESNVDWQNDRRQGGRACWVAGDAWEQMASVGTPPADLLFTCPPYGSLERYSDKAADLSAMAWPAFVASYAGIIGAAAKVLNPDRFAVFVVGNYRDRRDINGRAVNQDRPLRDLVGATIAAFRAAGLRWYDEAHLVTPVGTLAARTAYVWPRSRKLGRSHQTVLVFVKGCPKRATEWIQE